MCYHTPREYCNGIARMSAVKSAIVALYLIIGQMQVSTAISANTSKSLMVLTYLHESAFCPFVQ